MDLERPRRWIAVRRVPAVLNAVAQGFDPSVVTSAVVSWEDAEDALADPPMKLILSR